MSDQNTQPTNAVNISSKQVAQVSATALGFFRMETTLIPGNIRRQLDVLEAVLTGLASGDLVVASPAQLAVELEPDKETKDTDDGGPPDTKTPEAEIKKGRKPARRKFPKKAARVAQGNSPAGSDGSASGAE